MGWMRTRVSSQVVFVTCSPGRAVVDATLVDGAALRLAAGTPITFVLRLPESHALAALVETTLRRWTEQSCRVDVELDGRAEGDRATMTDGTATIRLEVEAAA
jgi:hypothetical protein